ncbi:solute carrier family 26 member 10 isoform X1 [Nilaparvata lugens]|uniref:solute carrier family 26 member 10 isoform X1 n=3 Tax=Nilaparvata lugens TaxID=108931 RepID=UPI00193E4946|nr:solute carrier family 26 member 10 isoform X1 [Nilaparvata lugens]XP_039297763.1 solute carrier family 26 member 10 isoform X1 [Nilaparvata lugens]XP_039297764.1 solute carrier family 26 member 10 isoform X1 [Nilaparvata lugens]XP_039297765.1 solute carrier family 26 member 10 isoform X1 [Nilaparvata lugens]
MEPEENDPLLGNEDSGGKNLGEFGTCWMMDATMKCTHTSSTHVKVDRPIYPQTMLDEAYRCKSQQAYPLDIRCSECNPGKMVKSMIPAIDWLSRYSFKQDLPKDIIAGLTVGIMNIPQGMAYAILGNVPPVVGLYMAFFPTIIYAFLGTSRHISMGSFAVICLMAGKTVSTYSSTYSLANIPVNSTLPYAAEQSGTSYSPIEVAMAVTFMVGIFQLGMYLLRLGVICTLLSDTLVNGLTAGAAIHVFTSQIKDLLGMNVPKYTGPLYILRTYIGIFENLHTINYVATFCSAVTMVALIINNEILKPWISKKSIIPIPIELIVVLAGTLLSRYAYISDTHNLSVVGHIAVGLPEAAAPKLSLLSLVALDSFVISVVAYIISVSMALIFAQKLKYTIDSNQELLAQGVGNVVGSFFSCLPFAASLSRSAIQEMAGGVTQVASLFSCSVLLVVLLWIAPFFEPLPRCFLAALIIVALKGVLFQVKDFFRIWKMSTLDGITWLVTYLTVILVEIDIGLLVGVFVSIVTIFIQGMKPYTCQLARLPNTDIYVDSTRYTKTEEVKGVCIVHYAGGLNFANRVYFKKAVHQIYKECAENEVNLVVKGKSTSDDDIENGKIQFIILNLSAMQYVDPAGSSTISSIAQEFSQISVNILLAAVGGPVHDAMQLCGVFGNNLITCFPTIHDAVLYAESKMNRQRLSIRL